MIRHAFRLRKACQAFAGFSFAPPPKVEEGFVIAAFCFSVRQQEGANSTRPDSRKILTEKHKGLIVFFKNAK